MGPGGDVSTSAGKVTWETPWKFSGDQDQPWRQMEGEPLGTEWTGSNPYSTYWWFLDLQRDFDPSKMKMAWETKATLEASLLLREIEGKVSLIQKKPDS